MCCRDVLIAASCDFRYSNFCCSRAASIWICSLTLCSASSRFSWSMRRCAWAIRAFRSSVDSLPANTHTDKHTKMFWVFLHPTFPVTVFNQNRIRCHNNLPRDSKGHIKKTTDSFAAHSARCRIEIATYYTSPKGFTTAPNQL